jgi:hypothetical protein
MPSTCYILRNDIKNGMPHFSDVTAEVCGSIQKAGMVTTAQWVDINNDHYPELVIAGDWMPVMLFSNTKGKLEDIFYRIGAKKFERHVVVAYCK